MVVHLSCVYGQSTVSLWSMGTLGVNNYNLLNLYEAHIGHYARASGL